MPPMESRMNEKSLSSFLKFNLPADMRDEASKPVTLEESAMGERSSTWPPGPEAKVRAAKEGKQPADFFREKAVPDIISKPNLERIRSRSRFSLPTIQELRTYERDTEFAKLEDRPKRGLNLPRSKSVRPSTMSKLLLSLDDGSDIESESVDSPISSSASPLMSQSPLAAPRSPGSPSDPAAPRKSSIKFLSSQQRSAESPGTPAALHVPAKGKNRLAFFMNEN